MTALCPRCKRPTLEVTQAKVVDSESTRIGPVVACSSCEFVEETTTILNLKRA